MQARPGLTLLLLLHKGVLGEAEVVSEGEQHLCGEEVEVVLEGEQHLRGEEVEVVPVWRALQCLQAERIAQQAAAIEAMEQVMASWLKLF
jgi:hypothetical protein